MRRCGSLPRNPRGKMPLYGKVAGYKQPAVASPDHGRPAATGFKQPATASPDHAGFKHTNYSAKSDNSGIDGQTYIRYINCLSLHLYKMKDNNKCIFLHMKIIHLTLAPLSNYLSV